MQRTHTLLVAFYTCALHIFIIFNFNIQVLSLTICCGNCIVTQLLISYLVQHIFKPEVIMFYFKICYVIIKPYKLVYTTTSYCPCGVLKY